MALGAGLRPLGDAGPGRGRSRVLHERRAPSLSRDVLAAFPGGRVVVGVTSTPFKCPPAPSETALLMHDFLTARGLRDGSRDRAGDAARPCPMPPSPEASAAILEAFAERGIEWHPERLVRGLDPDRRVGLLVRRRGDALRPVPRRPRAPGAGGGGRGGPDRRRLDPRRSVTLETRSRTCTRSATSPAWARPRQGCSPRARRGRGRGPSSPACRGAAATPGTTDAASATSSSATTRSRRSTSPSWRRAPSGDLDGPSTELPRDKGDVRPEPGPALVRPRVVRHRRGRHAVPLSHQGAVQGAVELVPDAAPSCTHLSVGGMDVLTQMYADAWAQSRPRW